MCSYYCSLHISLIIIILVQRLSNGIPLPASKSRQEILLLKVDSQLGTRKLDSLKISIYIIFLQ